MTDVNGLRLAYRGFVAGLAGAYVWVALAMVLSLPAGGPLGALPALASLAPAGADTAVTEAFVFGLGLAQVAGAGVGMLFAYFFARFFTVRATLTMAAVCVSMLAWAMIGTRLGASMADPSSVVTSVTLLVATIGYGWVLASWVPVRGEVLRYSGSPVT